MLTEKQKELLFKFRDILKENGIYIQARSVFISDSNLSLSLKTIMTNNSEELVKELWFVEYKEEVLVLNGKTTTKDNTIIDSY